MVANVPQVKKKGMVISMIDNLNRLALYFTFPMVQNAMIVGVLIALCSSLLGVILVLKRFSFIGAGLSHVAFAATAIAAAMHLTNNFLFVLPATMICAVLVLRTGQNTKLKGDAAIAVISVGSLAIGFLVMNIFPTSANVSGDVCTLLFGSTSILTLLSYEVWISAGLSLMVIVVFVVFYNKIFAITFDEDFSLATGNKAKLYNLILAVVIAVVIVLAMELVGALLISALIIFPALSAMRVLKTFKAVTICSVIIAVLCSVLGMLSSMVAETPVGPTVVAANVGVFVVFFIIGVIKKFGFMGLLSYHRRSHKYKQS